MDLDQASLLAFLIPGVILPVVLTAIAFWSPSKRQIRRWGAACDVAITEANIGEIRAHLGRSRRFRSVASLPFWWLGCVRVIDGSFPAAIATPAIGLGAYLIGALVAELTGPVARPAGVRQAALVPRLVRDYRPSWVRTLIVSSFGLAAALTVLAVAVADASRSSRAAVTLAIALGVAALAEVAARRIVVRPQRDTDLDLLAADEGLRAAAVSLTSGAALLAGLVAAMTGATAAVPEATGAWAILLIPFVVVVDGAGVGVLTLIIRQETWGYRRRYVQQPQAVAA